MLSKRRPPKRSSALDLVRDLIGSVTGPADLSVNKTHLTNFGRSTLRRSDRRKTVGKSTNENATETPGEPMTDLRVSRDGPCNASHFSEEFQSGWKRTRFTEALIEPFERRLRRVGP